MGDKSKIEWTDAKWNPIRGCSVVSEGWRNCYAMQILEGMRQLVDDEKRELALGVLSDPKLEVFVEELDDNLMCERAVNEEPREPFSSDELTKHEL